METIYCLLIPEKKGHEIRNLCFESRHGLFYGGKKVCQSFE